MYMYGRDRENPRFFALVIFSLDCIIQISFINIESKEFIDTFLMVNFLDN